MSTPTWSIKKFKIKDLKEYAKNPRRLTESQYLHLKASLDKFGLVDKPIVTQEGQIIGGHQRIKVLKKGGIKEIECWVPDRDLSEKEIEEANIRLNKNQGEWDYDILGNQFEMTDLLQWGFEPSDLAIGEEIIPETSDDISLPNDEKNLMQITFTLSIEQKEFIDECLVTSKNLGNFHNEINENSNGNALHRICEQWRSLNGRS